MNSTVISFVINYIYIYGGSISQDPDTKNRDPDNPGTIPGTGNGEHSSGETGDRGAKSVRGAPISYTAARCVYTCQ